MAFYKLLGMVVFCKEAKITSVTIVAQWKEHTVAVEGLVSELNDPHRLCCSIPNNEALFSLPCFWL